MQINFTLNSKAQSLTIDPMQSLLKTLRDVIGLKATKEGCGEGECGACSAIVNGKLVNTCLFPIAQVDGAEVLTLEGLRETPRGRCLIDALLTAKGVQCGFCTPGMVLALYQVLVNSPDVKTITEQDIRVGISGNLCRCTGYAMIVDAVKIAVEQGGDLW
ncbi:(2Fe-2S)-binding protein [Shewanella sp. UCD-KL12]|uniref:(2Fe-2S)-binding protein n=1 Tax=Shewanella sp. UCD-KL12 TaxID=1917163 RepID=UPI0009708EE4|nr:(2Fe-2S)-binding protein [Shewanella sp. UCD-KL12]